MSEKEAVSCGQPAFSDPSLSPRSPIEDATDIAIKTTAQFLQDNAPGELSDVVFCTFSASDMAVYEERIPHFIAGS